jgi:uncharacterized OB-fold protein
MFPARYAREMPHRYRMEAHKCKQCGKVFVPRRLKCDKCGAIEFEVIKLSDKVKLLTYTIIHTPASQFKDQSPYALGICEFPEGVRLTAQVVDIDFEEIKTGMELQVEFRRIQTDGHEGILSYGYKFVPVI